ncbi:MAG: MFS transporter, partial [Schleiferiaceae bacterium]|nr:MFS transporter [Schleiferiaceae bacterium]
MAALGYFVDIYDLLMFSILRVPSLQSLGLSDAQIATEGLRIINFQMAGLLLGGILWGVLGDKRGRLKVLFASILLYSLGNLANAWVQTVDQYAWVRFISGIGLAGELGVGITLVAELLPKEKRGLGTSLVAAVGLSGAVAAFFMKEWLDWRSCYAVGGLLGLALLFLRIRVSESGMFQSVAQNPNVPRGRFLDLFRPRARAIAYLQSILIGLPTWYVIGILVSFSREFARDRGLPGEVDPGFAIMVA